MTVRSAREVMSAGDGWSTQPSLAGVESDDDDGTTSAAGGAASAEPGSRRPSSAASPDRRSSSGARSDRRKSAQQSQGSAGSTFGESRSATVRHSRTQSQTSAVVDTARDRTLRHAARRRNTLRASRASAATSVFDELWPDQAAGPVLTVSPGAGDPVVLPDASDSSSDEEEEDSRTWINEDEALAAMSAPRLLRDDRYGAWRVAIAESEDDPFAHQERMLSMSGADAARCMDALWTVVELCGPWAVRVRIAQARDALPVLAQATTHPRLPGPHWLGARVAGRAVRGLPPTASMTGLLPARQVCHLLLAYIRQSAAQHPANASAPLNAVGVDVASGSAD